MNIMCQETADILKMSELERVCYFVANIKQARIRSISSTIEDVTGYPCGEFKNPSWSFLKKIFSSNDLNRLKVSWRLLLFYGRRTASEHSRVASVAEKFYIRHASGMLRQVEVVIRILQYDEYGFPTEAVGEIKVIADEEQSGSRQGDPSISTREREVLNLLAQGYSSKEIAEKLFISDHTSMTHRKNLIVKFNVKNTAELIKEASKYFTFA